ncbi:YitT family protein [Niallia taxi]|uniref:YitT family protein n=1 Tax=Niallia taxi TaxID=2499688 RepID=UPI003D2D4298
MLKKLLVVGFGSTMIGIGINGFIMPFHLINGGVFGISLLVNYIWGIKIGVIFFLINIPIYLFALKLAPSFFKNGLIGMMISGVIIDLFGPLNGIFHLQIMSSVIFGSILIGIGVGVMLRYHISPGGMDLLALLFAKRTKLNVGVILFLMDTTIIITALFLIHDIKILYSLVIVSIVGLLAFIITTFQEVKFYVR